MAQQPVYNAPVDPMMAPQPNAQAQAYQQPAAMAQSMQAAMNQQTLGDAAMIDYTLFNSDRSVMRCTSDRIPNNYNLLKDSQIPYGVVVKPFGDGVEVSDSICSQLNCFYRERKCPRCLLATNPSSDARSAGHTSTHSSDGLRMDKSGSARSVAISTIPKSTIIQRLKLMVTEQTMITDQSLAAELLTFWLTMNT